MTPDGSQDGSPLKHFNSHTREGVTILAAWEILPSYFNSHTREGVTRQNEKNFDEAFNFNSHTREGVTPN